MLGNVENKDCIFCNLKWFETIYENDACVAVYDKYPVNPGHVLVIPKRHIETCFDLKPYEVEKMYYAVMKAKEEIEKKFSPDGYNIGFNCGESGGQTINHCHMHIIPRYKGDVENPRGGIRGVIPNKKEY
jgi:diadenosine tetraphosphate (Ap4A) HIT family hydrolase